VTTPPADSEEDSSDETAAPPAESGEEPLEVRNEEKKPRTAAERKKLAEKHGLVVLPGGMNPSEEPKPASEGPVLRVEKGGKPASSEASPKTDTKESKTTNHRALLVLVSLLPVALLAALIGGFFAYRTASENSSIQAGLQEANAAAEQGRYEDAIAVYRRLLSIYPDRAEIQDALTKVQNDQEEEQTAKVLETLAQAEMYLKAEDFFQAQLLLNTLKLSEEDSNLPRLIALQETANLAPQLEHVDLGNFPVVTLTLACGAEVTRDEVSVREGGIQRNILDFDWQGGRLMLVYQTEDAPVTTQPRRIAVTITKNGYQFTRQRSYTIPSFQPAAVSVIATDVNAYPIIRAYLHVEQQDAGAAIENLDRHAFAVQEQLPDGTYLPREVQTVMSMEEVGVNISLVADQSALSMEDLQKLQGVMTQFVQSLRYDVGDRAELRTFDGMSQTLYPFANDSELLVAGIQRIPIGDGQTALYQAIHDSIESAASQGGVRCVIVFASGRDSNSPYTPDDLIQRANATQTPVYLIGTGDVDMESLSAIAENTGGQFWYVEDLYELQQINSNIYAKQKECYVVEYATDSPLDAYSTRTLEVTVTGGGCRGMASASF